MIDKETPLLNITQQAFEEEKVPVHCVFAMGLHTLLWKSIHGRGCIGAFDVIALSCCRIGFIDFCCQTEFAPLRSHRLLTGNVMVGIELQPGKAAMWIWHAKIQSLDGEVSQGTLTVGSKTLALSMEEVETVIAGFGVNVRDFDDAAKRHLVDQ